MAGDQRIVGSGLTDPLDQVDGLLAADGEVYSFAVEPDHGVRRCGRVVGAERGDVVHDWPRIGWSGAGGGTVAGADKPPAAAVLACAAVEPTAVDAGARRGGCRSGMAGIKIVAFFGDDDRVGGAVEAGGHAIAFIGRKHASPGLHG